MDAVDLRHIADAIDAAEKFKDAAMNLAGETLDGDRTTYLDCEQWPVFKVYKNNTSEVIGIVCMDIDAVYGYYDTTTDEFKENT